MSKRKDMQRRSGETWRQLVERLGAHWSSEAVRDFDLQLNSGIPEAEAARHALCAWRRIKCAP